MAYIRPCNKCGQRISMREMRAGQWVAFDASTQNPHKCGKKTKADPKIKPLNHIGCVTDKSAYLYARPKHKCKIVPDIAPIKTYKIENSEGVSQK